MIKLSVRSLEPHDFDRCWAIYGTKDRFSANETDQIRKAWHYLLPRDEMIGVIVEDFGSSTGPQVVSFGASAFVTDDWMLSFRADPRPGGITRALLSAGTPDSAVLNFRQIGIYGANGGLNLVCVHQGELSVTDDSNFSLLADTFVRVFQEAHRGFHLREMLNEARGALVKNWCTSGGNWIERNDFTKYYSSAPEILPDEENYPFLIGATKNETTTNSALWSMFNHVTPTLKFSTRQKHVFLRAVRGKSSRIIATELQMTEDAVAACFRAGYERLDDHPTLRAEFWGNGNGSAEPKKQRFLNFLRNHMEELRPWSTKPFTRASPTPVFLPPQISNRIREGPSSVLGESARMNEQCPNPP